MSKQAQPNTVKAPVDAPADQTVDGAQQDEQATNVAIVQTTNVYPSGAKPAGPAKVATDGDGWYTPTEQKAVMKVKLPDGRTIESEATIATYSNQNITMTTSGESAKQAEQKAAQTPTTSGPQQTADSEAQATPTQETDAEATVDVTP